MHSPCSSLWCHLHLPSNIYDPMIQVSSNTSVRNIYKILSDIHKLHYNVKSYEHFVSINKERQRYSVCFNGTQPALNHQPSCCCCVCVRDKEREGGREGGREGEGEGRERENNYTTFQHVMLYIFNVYLTSRYQ